MLRNLSSAAVVIGALRVKYTIFSKKYNGCCIIHKRIRQLHCGSYTSAHVLLYVLIEFIKLVGEER